MIDKDKVVKSEHRRLARLAKGVPDDKKSVATALVTELAFMAGTLAELRDFVNSNGAVDLFKNGKQEMLRESPALKSYNTTINRYSQLYKQLCELLPKDGGEQQSELLEFLTQEV